MNKSTSVKKKKLNQLKQAIKTKKVYQSKKVKKKKKKKNNFHDLLFVYCILLYWVTDWKQ